MVARCLETKVCLSTSAMLVLPSRERTRSGTNRR